MFSKHKGSFYCSNCPHFRKENQLYLGKLMLMTLSLNAIKFSNDNRLIFKLQLRFNSEPLNIPSEMVDKISWSSSDDKGIQPIDCKQAYAYRTSVEIIHKTDKIKCVGVLI